MTEQLSKMDAARKEAIKQLHALEIELGRTETAFTFLVDNDPMVNTDADQELVARCVAAIDVATHDLLMLATSLFGRQRVAELFDGEFDSEAGEAGE